ncbi:MAG: hypothetical protein WBX38_06140 [Candidatus Sulfotelmatobacter sp.]
MSPGQGQTGTYNKERQEYPARPPGTRETPKYQPEHLIHYEDSENVIASLGDPVSCIVSMCVVTRGEPSNVRSGSERDI